MLAPERVKPFLVHADPDVRTFAADYFGDGWSQDADVLPGVLDAFERYRTATDVANVAAAHRLVMTAPALDRVLGLLERLDDRLAVEAFSRLVAQAPAALLRDRCDAIEANPQVRPRHLIRIRRRRDFLEWSGGRLADELRAFARRTSGRPQTNEADREFADDLADALSRHGVPDAGTLCRLLEQTGPASGWLAALLIDVAGRRRVREAVPALVAKLQADDDDLPGLAAAALARVGDPEAARRIRREFPDAPFHFRLYACEALGYLKHPESEAAALDLLEREEDEGIRMWLCVALSDLVSERTVEVLSREVERSHSDEVFRELCGPALIASTLLGVDPPRDAGHWRQERARQRAAIAAASVPSPDTQTASAQKITPPAAATRQERLGPEVAVLPENTRHRVGRNDPCPCGSGKKYKKCCGQAG